MDLRDQLELLDQASAEDRHRLVRRWRREAAAIVLASVLLLLAVHYA